MWRDSAEVNEVINQIPQKVVQRGQFLFREGDRLESVDILIAGAIKITKITAGGDEWISRFKLSGDWIGLSDYPGERHSVSACALDTCSIRRVPLAMLARMLRIEETRPVILKLINGNLRQQLNYAILRRLRARERLAGFISNMSGYYERQGCSARSFNLPMSRNEMASYLDLTPETVSRELRAFEREGVIQTSRKEITIVDVNNFFQH